MKLTPIITDKWKADGGACFGVVPKTMWSKIYPADENNLIEMITRVLLIEWEDKKILIDVGMGRKQNEKFYQYKYLWGNPDIIEELSKLDIQPEDITDIIFTHLHDDHVGGASFLDEKGNIQLYFPNANYWVSKTQWEWANNPNPREKGSYFKNNLEILEQSGKLHLIDGDDYSFSAEIQLKLSNGHTRGQLIPYIKYKNQTIVCTGDFIPSIGHVNIPYIASYDIEPLLVMKEKEAFLKEAIEKDYILFFVHDAICECCNLKETPKAYTVNKTFSITDIA